MVSTVHMSLTHIRKRNHDVVSFEPRKITNAMRGAYLEARGQVEQSRLDELTKQVIAYIERMYDGEDAVPSVEDVQNIVERTLMEADLFDVAKAYIIYRYEHQQQREEKKKEVIQKIESDGLMITKRNGQQERFSMEKLVASIKHFAHGYEREINVDMIAEQTRAELFEGISTKDIQKAIILVSRSYIELDPAYSKLATRILWDGLYKDIIGHDTINYTDFEKQYRIAFIGYIKEAVQIGRLDPKILMFDLNEMSAALRPERDDVFDYLGAQTLYDRYFIQNPYTKRILETPQFFWMRTAMGLALNESDREGKAKEFYEIISTLRFVPSTPTLFHAGTPHPQLSSCYLNTVMDDLGHIFKVYGDNAQLSKWSGGIGTDWTYLRATGALIKSNGVESQGVIPFLKIANDVTVAINRSGKRRGATCAYLETWHLDIEDFLDLRKNTGDDRRRTHDMNTANWIPDLFMQRVRDDKDWTLFSPEEVPDLHDTYGSEFKRRYEQYEAKAARGEIRLSKIVKAKDLWRKMIGMIFETGHPWMTWKDACNVRSPQDHVGVIHNSNLCTEITLNTSEEETAVCNLGSIKLGEHIENGQINHDKLRETVTIAIRMLDNVIDLNYYPTKEGETSNKRHRPIGIGIMGFQDALYKANVHFDSDAAITFADQSMEAISYYSIAASALLAKEKGAYQTFRGSKWDRGILPLDTLDLLERERGEAIPVDRSSTMDWDAVRALIKEHGMRNSNVMALAPTATISNISGCFPTIEPIYKNIYVKSNMSGEFTVVNDYLIEELKGLGLWTPELLAEIKQHDGSIQHITQIPQDIRDKYKEVFDMDPLRLVRITAYRGKWIDQSQSFNIFYKGTSGKEISDIYQYAWMLGLKTTYYLRSTAATTVEKSSISLAAKQPEAAPVSSAPTPTPAATSSAVTSQYTESPIPTAMNMDIVTSSVVNTGSNAKLTTIGEPDCEACQ